MKAIARSLFATVSLAALAMSPALANADSKDDAEVVVTTSKNTVQVTILNSLKVAINCETSVDGGPPLSIKIDAESADFTEHKDVPVGDHTVTWSCPTDAKGPTKHGAGSEKVKVTDEESPFDLSLIHI